MSLLKKFCSRRELRDFRHAGLIKVLTWKPDLDLQFGDVEISDRARRLQQEKKTVVLHKPLYFHSIGSASFHGPTAVQKSKDPERSARYLLKKTEEGDPQRMRGLNVASLLSPSFEGLLVFTQNGLIARLINCELEHEFEIRVTEDLKALETLNQVELIRSELPLNITGNFTFRVVGQGGLFQSRLQVLLKESILTVVRVARIRIGSLHLGQLKHRHWRFLTPSEAFLLTS